MFRIHAVILGACLIAWSCSSGDHAAVNAVSAASAGVSEEGLYEHLRQEALHFDLAAFRARSPLTGYRLALAASTDDGVVIGGVTLHGLRSYLTAQHGSVARVLGRDQTVGARLDRLHQAASWPQLTRADVKAFVATLRLAFTGVALGFGLNPYDDQFTGLSCADADHQDSLCDRFASSQCQGPASSCNDGNNRFTYTQDQAVAACHAAYSRVLADPRRHCGDGGTANAAGTSPVNINACSGSATCVINGGGGGALNIDVCAPGATCEIHPEGQAKELQ